MNDDVCPRCQGTGVVPLDPSEAALPPRPPGRDWTALGLASGGIVVTLACLGGWIPTNNAEWWMACASLPFFAAVFGTHARRPHA